jgi:hypothetical protein
MVNTLKLNRWMTIFYTILLTVLIVGTPLLFSSLTRSVFEVNKLLLLRYSTLLTLFLWLTHYFLLRDNNALDTDSDPANTYHIGKFSWKKIGLEKIIIVWLIFNCISTIFSPNIRVSIIGAYDRWEGIITLVNYMILLYMYAKLVTRKYQLFWIVGGILVSTALSAYYGVLQSVGYDFMHWSADPTFRVFACINNPVHYCAYVGMVTPIGIALTLLLLTRTKPNSESTPTKLSLSRQILSQPIITGIKALSIAIGIGIYYFIFTPSLVSPSFIQLLLLIGFGITVTESLNQSQLTWQNILKWGCFLLILVGLSAVNVITITKYDWVAFFTILSPYVVLAALPDKQEVLRRLVFIGTGLIFYTMYLSFSRATWVGFFLAMPLFYLGCTGALKSSTQIKFIRSFFYKAGFVVTNALLYNFDMYSFGWLPTGIIGSIFLIFFLLSFYNEHGRLSTQLFYPLVLMGLVIMGFHDTLWAFPIFFKYVLMIMVLFWSILTHKKSPLLYQAILITLFFGHLQFVSQGLVHCVAYLVLVISYGYILFNTSQINTTKNLWLSAYLLIMGIGVILPKIPILLMDLKMALVSSSLIITSLYSLLGIGVICLTATLVFPATTRQSRRFIYSLLLITVIGLVSVLGLKILLQNNDALMKQTTAYTAAHHMAGRANSKLDTKVFSGMARIAMWKSVTPWVKDYWLLGSGPDTIKALYPVYRHPSYGILEGGHNYTPDKLHNEYLNTVTTRGITGFLIYYVGIILGWVILILKKGYTMRESPYFYMVFAVLTGVGIYLGQVLFNFGVVATLVLFYILMGLGVALVTHPDYRKE